MNLKKLADPFPPSKVSWRIGQVVKNNPSKASALCYIDARDVMEKLDEAVGPQCWQDRYEVHGPRVICTISIKIGDEWVGKSDGAGDTQVEGEKGGISDAFKRAAVKWGVGRYLYDIPVQYVAIEPQYKKILPGEYAKLAKALPGSRIHDDGVEDVTSGNGARAPTNGQQKAVPKKFDLLFPNGDVLATFSDPDEWCHGLRQALTQDGAPVLAIWERNKPLAEVIRDHYPGVQWADRKGVKWSAFEVIEAAVGKLVPGIVA